MVHQGMPLLQHTGKIWLPLENWLRETKIYIT